MTERKMKDSGIPWIGIIPEEWKVSKIGELYTNRYERVSDKDFPPLSVTMQGILPQLETAAKTEDGDNRKLVRKGDFAINSRSDRRGSCGISPYDGSVSLINLILAPRNEMNANYYNWLFHTSLFADEFYSWGHGIVADLWTTRWQEMKNIAIPIPDIKEQEAIAVWLDGKCGEIDELIEVEQKMIEELEAYRQATITETVTRGLNPDVPMRQTSISWFPEIPKHWNLCRLKCLCYRMQSGDALTSMQINSSGKYRVYGGNGLRGYYDKSNFTGEAIIIGRQGALCGNVHYINGSIWTTDHAVVTTPSPLSNIKYLYYLTLGMNLNQYASQTAAQPGLAVGQIKNVLTVNPPLAEQQAIADYLDAKCKEIDDLIAMKREKIETLKQYRQSIIFEAVTGKTQIN